MGTRTQRTYPDEVRAVALALVELRGGKGHVKAVASFMGMPDATLRGWFVQNQKQNGTATFARIQENKKEDLVEMLESLARTAIGVLDDPAKLGAASVRDVSVTAGIAIDKLQLLTGEATSRTETVDRGIYANMKPEGAEEIVIDAEIIEEVERRQLGTGEKCLAKAVEMKEGVRDEAKGA